MECPVCLNAWDLQDVRPKGLPCQHTFCQSCLGRLESRQCPTCRQAFVEPVPDNYTLLGVLQAFHLERPRGWWCLTCRSTSTQHCVGEHAVLGLPGGAAQTALRLLRGQPATCRVTLRQDDGEAFNAEWRVDGDGQGTEDLLLQTLVVALAASGRLLQEPNRAHADAPPAAQQSAEDCIEQLDLWELGFSRPYAPNKLVTLRVVRQRGVRRIINLWGDIDPEWVLELLQCAAPTLVQLLMYNGREDHLAAVHTMPQLQRLDFEGTLGERFVELPALPQPSSLKWLRVKGLSRATTVSLLRAHAPSLDELWLVVDSVTGGEWPNGCEDLDALLGQCELRLKRIVLWRKNALFHPPLSSCPSQVEAVRRVLPGSTVKCNVCDEVAYEHL